MYDPSIFLIVVAWIPKGEAASDATNVKVFSLDLHSKTMQIKWNHRVFAASSNDRKTGTTYREKKNTVFVSAESICSDWSYHVVFFIIFLHYNDYKYAKISYMRWKSCRKLRYLFKSNIANIHEINWNRNKWNVNDKFNDKFGIDFFLAHYYLLSLSDFHL